MAILDIKTKDKIEIGRKPRVYFTCHPDDFELYFERISEDILKYHSCAVYYTKDMNEKFEEADKAINLARQNLFVVPVTFKLLTTKNRAMDEDIPYAIENNIPVLPFMMEEGIDFIYSQKNKFGTRQYINPESKDPTEISYDHKLKIFLDSVLFNPLNAEQIRSAFSAHLFLSYRKVNRHYANEFLNFIHSNPEFRDVSVWFDEFLILGESFSENIEKNIDDSDLFTLLVTPDILEKIKDDESGETRDNYVVSNELPYAKASKKPIMAVEWEKTDREKLSKINITELIASGDKEIYEKVLKYVIKKPDSGIAEPYRSYLIGLAYLEGIDVEVNRPLAVELITQSAEEGCPEAMNKLYVIYRDGDGASRDYSRSAMWAKKAWEYCVSAYGESDRKAFDALEKYAGALYCNGEYAESEKRYNQIYKSIKNNKDDINVPIVQNNRAACFMEMGMISEGLKCRKKAYKKYAEIKGKKHQDTLKMLSNLGSDYDANGFYKKALIHCEKAYEMQADILEKNHKDTLLSLNNIGNAYLSLGEYEKALDKLNEAYSLSVEARGKEDPDSLLFFSNIAVAKGKMGIFEECEKLHKETYDLRCKVLGENHPDTLMSLHYYACALCDNNHPDDAIYHHKRVVEAIEKLSGENNRLIARALNGFAKTYQSLDEDELCYKTQKRAYEIYRKICGRDDLFLADVTYNFAVACIDFHQYEEAYKVSKEAYKLMKNIYGENHPYTEECLAMINWLSNP